TPVLELLPAIRRAVPKMTVLIDSGFRRGSDVFKALALGADCVGLGTQLVVACAAAGQDGVRHMLHLLQDELERVMCRTGSPTVNNIERSVLHMPASPPCVTRSCSRRGLESSRRRARPSFG